MGFLIHKSVSHAVRNFNAINERIAYVDVHLHSWKLRIISVYYPHTGYGDTHVQPMYDTLTEILRDAQTNHLHPIIAGDFNAQVGKHNDDDTTTTTGKFALDPSNSRGEWLTSWAASQHLIITNTHFDKPLSDIITYYSPTPQPRQLDYIITNRALWKRTRDAHSTQCSDLGSDHRAVRLVLSTPSTKQPRRQQRLHKQQPTPWPPTDLDLFRHTISDQLNHTSTTNNLDHHCSAITNAIITAASAGHQRTHIPHDS